MFLVCEVAEMFFDPKSSPPRHLTLQIDAILESARHRVYLFIDEVL
jgi:hypothetical protein